MITKEQGYDEFLAEKIRLGREDIANGRFYTLKEAEAHWQRTIERKALEMALLDEELADELHYA
ncbi:hypothetical protein [Lonepinella sp. BR2357]|uniref:hypothetical protein n=1 Tax=Lonepinella sp. BR2357 TaxID=3434549 RepID=UPI003F6DA87F